MFGFFFSWFIGQGGSKISCTKIQTLPNLRLLISSGHAWQKRTCQSSSVPALSLCRWCRLLKGISPKVLSFSSHNLWITTETKILMTSKWHLISLISFVLKNPQNPVFTVASAEKQHRLLHSSVPYYGIYFHITINYIQTTIGFQVSQNLYDFFLLCHFPKVLLNLIAVCNRNSSRMLFQKQVKQQHRNFKFWFSKFEFDRVASSRFFWLGQLSTPFKSRNGYRIDSFYNSFFSTPPNTDDFVGKIVFCPQNAQFFCPT